MNKSKFKTSKESGPHLRLLNLIGDWDGNTRTWLEKDILADESPTNGKISALLTNVLSAMNITAPLTVRRTRA